MGNQAKGGKAAASKLTPEERSERAKNAAAKRWAPKQPAPQPDIKRGVSPAMRAAREHAREKPVEAPRFSPPVLPKGVVPDGKSPAIAMDYNPMAYEYANSYCGMFSPFPGYPYLANLTTRPEYRAFAEILSSELTREWIKIKGASDRDGDTQAEEDKLRIPQLEEAIKNFDLKGVFKVAATHDCFFGRGQISINIKGADETLPLVLSPKTIKIDSLVGFTPIEPMWTTPNAYNANDPTAPDFYQPRSWFVLGKEVHASRLLSIVTRPMPDMLRPAYNFSGMSMSQLAEPYVNNWLRTRQSVSDLINNFSITVLKTNMGNVLTGGCDDGADIFARADLFTLTRSNRGLMMLDMEGEDLAQVNTPLSGLHELQAQSQEHLSAVSRIPTMIYTGISPTGMNASSEGEIRVFYDWISSQQEAYYRQKIDICLKVIMLHLWGEIDESITFEFNSLWQISAKEQSEIRLNNANANRIYASEINAVSQEEVREQLASDPDSGFSGINVADVPEPEIDPMMDALGQALGGQEQGQQDGDNPFGAQDEWDESKHPRADNGQFGSGSGGVIGRSSPPKSVYFTLADLDDSGGRAAVISHASEWAKNEPDRIDSINSALSDLGYPKIEAPNKAEATQSESEKEDQDDEIPEGDVDSSFGDYEFVSAKSVIPPHEVRDKEKLDAIVSKMKTEGWQGRPILTFDIGQGQEALTGSHRIAAAKLAGIEVPIVQIDDDIADYTDKHGKTIRDVAFMDADRAAVWLKKAGHPDASKLMMAEYESDQSAK